MSDGQGGRLVAIGERLKEVAGHLGAVLDELEEVQNEHLAEYDSPSTTGDTTKGVIQTAVDELSNQIGNINQAGEDVRDHGERIISVQGS